MKKTAFLALTTLIMIVFSSCKKECTEPNAYDQDANGNCRYRLTLLSGNWHAIEHCDAGSCGVTNPDYQFSIEPLNEYTTAKITILNLGNLDVDATATLFNNDDGDINIIIDNQTKMANGNTYNIMGSGTINAQNTAVTIDYTLMQQNAPNCIYDFTGGWYKQ